MKAPIITFLARSFIGVGYGSCPKTTIHGVWGKKHCSQTIVFCGFFTAPIIVNILTGDTCISVAVPKVPFTTHGTLSPHALGTIFIPFTIGI